ncbi:MAG: cupin domain-containing protein [Pseudomonadota bacterium]
MPKNRLQKDGKVLADPEVEDAGFFVAEGASDAPFRTALHVHRHSDEFVHVLEGRLRVTILEKSRDLTAGDNCFMPRTVPHRFEALEPSRWLVVGPPAYQAERRALQQAAKAGLRGAELYAAIDGVDFVAE